MENLLEELGIPKKYLKSTSKDDRFIGLVPKSWLKSLLRDSKLTEFIERHCLETWPYAKEDVGQSWTKIFIRVYKKSDAKVIPLPRIRQNTDDEPFLLFPQLMQFISQTNYKNLWKEAYKKYNTTENTKEIQVTLTDYNDVLHEIIERTYGCKIINTCDPTHSVSDSKDYDVHSNIFPALCGVETLNAIFLIHIPFHEHNLSDCVTFSSTLISRCYTKPLFIVYQLISALKAMHERSLTLGDINLSDIYLTEDLWLYIFPQLTSNIYIQNVPNTKQTLKTVLTCTNSTQHSFNTALKCVSCGIRTFDKVQITTQENLEQICHLWIQGQISNFTYLMALNNLAGRKFGDPNCHYVFPWVTDFSTRCGKTWRDLRKSKFRLNKGDRQLDLTYSNPETRVPHHVSDVLSSITYYVYMARRTPKSVLCRHVRPKWVPAEYPTSVQRMQEWTPDECIPELFSDPNVFKSIHDDLDDLEVPTWCQSPEDFILKHREALESSHVSERLHHWIDLTFGYKLAGNAAIKAKNVCLPLVDDHKNLTNSGVVQLFFHPHPQKSTALYFWGKTPPKIYNNQVAPSKHRHRDSSVSSTTSTFASNLELSKSAEDINLDETDSIPSHSNNKSSPLALSRLLSRSRSSLNEDLKDGAGKSQQRSSSTGPKGPQNYSSLNSSSTSKRSSNDSSTATIILPKEFNPAQALNSLENTRNFFSKTFHTEESKKILLDMTEHNEIKCEDENLLVQNAFTNRLFQETHSRNAKSLNYLRGRQISTPKQSIEQQVTCNYSEIISSRRIREMQILGCLIVEIFMSKQLRCLGRATTHQPPMMGVPANFSSRFKACLTVVKSCPNDIPICIRDCVDLLLQPDRTNGDFGYPSVTEFGLPPPTAHLLLEPLIHCLFPFNEQFFPLHKTLKVLKTYDLVANEVDLLYHFDCDGTRCIEYEPAERTKVLLMQNLAECKVKACTRDLETLLDNIDTNKDLEVVNILVPYAKCLLEDPSTSILTAWYLFDSISRALGPKATADHLLESLLKLYETDTPDSHVPFIAKIAKLYHHSFLLRLIVRLGLACFLDNFIAPLVEAVGGYRDLDDVGDVILHTHLEKTLRKTSHLKTIDGDHQELSPTSDSSESDKHVQKVPQEPEVFDFEGEDESDPMHTLIEHLELNIAQDLPFNHSSAEEALDATLTEHLDLSSVSDDDTYKSNLLSPTIPIPSCKPHEFTNITCDVGSKKSDYELDDQPKLMDMQKSASNSSYNLTIMSKSSSLKSKRSNSKISAMSADSLIWLSHRLGPVLTARFLSRNLLKMLTLCYVGKDNLLGEDLGVDQTHTDTGCDLILIAESRIVGDSNATKVLECLSSIAALYGEHFVLLQYLPHMSELIVLCKRKITPNLEGGLVSCLVLLKHIIPYLSDSTLMDQLQDVILKNIIYPTVRLLGSTKHTFPSGSTARNAVARKYLNTLYILSLRLGADMTRTHLVVPALQRFFLIFDKINDSGYFGSSTYQQKNISGENLEKSLEESHYVELRRDGTTTEWVIGGRPFQIAHARILAGSDSNDSISPPVFAGQNNSGPGEEFTINLAMEELQSVFTGSLAHAGYMPFLKLVGEQTLESSLKNHGTVRNLCTDYERELKQTQVVRSPPQLATPPFSSAPIMGSFGSGCNVSVVGNRIEVQDPAPSHTSSNPNNVGVSSTCVDPLTHIAHRMEYNGRHLRGNWLAYWEHEIGRAMGGIKEGVVGGKESVGVGGATGASFNFKQIKLQTFAGHAGSVRAICALDNENSFLSASRDKTVKLWSLRSHGDGNSVSTCQWTYTAHRKTVLSVCFVESQRLVASCDGGPGGVHLWDAWMGATVAQLDAPAAGGGAGGSNTVGVCNLRALPAPSACLVAATTDGCVRIADARVGAYVHELKVTLNPGAVLRSMTVPPSGAWLAVGHASGHVTVLDTRTGLVRATWRAHDADVLQLVAYGEDTLVSSGVDQTVAVWNVATDFSGNVGNSAAGSQAQRLKFYMKGTSEPVHCLSLHDSELISGTTGNRIGVHTSIDAEASFSSTKLRNDTFKGLLSSMVVLPLNRLLLLGADNGQITLLC